jgi:hypothetical protein
LSFGFAFATGIQIRAADSCTEGYGVSGDNGASSDSWHEFICSPVLSQAY